jgi:CHAT domain-containing protein
MPRQFLYHVDLQAAVQKADDQWRAGNWHDAFAQYCDIFSSRWQDLQKKEELLAPAELTILERITDFAVPMEMGEQSDTVLAHVVAGYQRQGDRYWTDRIRIKRIHLALNGHQLELARHQLGELFQSSDFSINSVIHWDTRYSHAAGSQDRDELLAQAWLETGRLMHLLGQNQQAVMCFNLGLGHSAASDASKVRLQLAVIASLIELGELDAARPRLAALKSNLDVNASPATLTTWHEYSARIDLLRGEFGLALRHVRQVWKICCQYRFVLPMLRAMINLAQFHILLNETIEARVILRHVYAKVRCSQNQLVVQVLRLFQVAGVTLHGGLERAASVIDEQQAKGEEEKEKAKRVETSDPLLFPAGGEECYTLAHFDDRALVFHWSLSWHSWVNARKSLDRLAPFRATDSKVIHARLDGMRAMLEYYAGEVASATKLLGQARNEFFQLGLEPDRWQIQVLWNRCLERLPVTDDERSKLAEERTKLARENEDLLESFGNRLPMRNRVNFFLDKATQLDEALASRIRKLQDLKKEMDEARLFRRLRLKFALWQGLNDLLDEAYWQKEAHHSRVLENPESTDPERKRTRLWRRLVFISPREATVAFLVFPDSTVGICRRWLSLDFWISKVPKPELRQKIGEWHRWIPRANPERLDETLSEITELLALEPMVNTLPRYVKTLRVLPDDVLHGLPYAAITLGSQTNDPCYLGKRFNVSIVFQPERQTRKRRAGHGTGKPLLAGVTVPLNGFPALDLTHDQIAWVQQWLEQRGNPCQPLFDDMACTQTICKGLASASLFHISCHGKFVQGDPKNTGLVLKTADGSEVLSLLELAKLPLEQLQHATLISCWGADNFILPGRWILSLPQVLWRAGVGTVLASLWEIEEKVAERFVKLFYEKLRDHPPDIALSGAQESMRQSAHDVQHWAGFQVYGDPSRLRF